MTTAEKIRRFVNLTFVLFFAVALILPGVDSLFQLDKTESPNEKRNLAEYPSFPQTKQELIDYPEKFEAYFKDHFGFRNLLIRWHSIVKVLWLGQSTTSEVVIGKKGWLFYDELDSIDDYRGVVTLSPQDLETIRLRLEARCAWLALRKLPCFLTVAPNKETIYSEYMPDTTPKGRTPTRLNQILSYLTEYSYLPVLDLRQPVLQAKSLGTIYYKTDSHWNQLGAYVGYREIMNWIAPLFPQLRPAPLSDFEIQVKPDTGQDLANLMALVDQIHDESVSLVPKTPRRALVTYSEDESDTFSSTQPNPNLPVAVVFRDSFGDAMVPFMAEHFSRAFYPRYAGGFDYATVEKEKPDLVIFEFVERGLYPWGGMPNPPEVDAEVCAHKFETLTDTRLLIRPEDAVQSLQSFYQTEITPNPDHILLQGSGSGPSILLPTFEYPTDQTLLFAMDITAPADTAMQVFYKTEAGQDYSTDQAYLTPLKAGRQKIYFELPVRKFAELLRLDLGTEVGDYLLHSLEIRAVPKKYKFPLGWEINGRPASG